MKEARKKHWRPDDTFHNIIDGEFKGVRRVNDALKKLGVKLGDKIVTSRDKDMQELVNVLRRETMPDGFEQWQLPIVLGGGNRPVMSFITVGNANAEVPQHRHRDDCLFRIVISGSLHFRDLELFPGDWMYVPTGQPYAFRAGKLGVVVMHVYNGGGLYPETSK